MENLCESCVHWKPRDTKNCTIQQLVHTIDMTKEISTIIVKCKKYSGTVESTVIHELKKSPKCRDSYVDKIMKDKKSTLEIQQADVEKFPLIERILWENIDTPTRESIIKELRCWNSIIKAMEEYKTLE